LVDDLIPGAEAARLLVGLAREAVETYVRERRFVKAPLELIPEMRQQAGVFVCLKKNGELRGCVGTFEPKRNNVAEEIIYNAVSSASRDPRFMPITGDELAVLSYSIDILGQNELVTDIVELDPKRYGVLVRNGSRRGLLLPDLDGIESAEHQLEIASQKAGIGRTEAMEIFRFEVMRYEDRGKPSP
jgi:AmmeMemoRadiSam system protein A